MESVPSRQAELQAEVTISTYPRTKNTTAHCSLKQDGDKEKGGWGGAPHQQPNKNNRTDLPGVAELPESVGGELARARGEGLPEGVRVAESGGVEGVVHLLGGGLAVALEDDLRQLRLTDAWIIYQEDQTVDELDQRTTNGVHALPTLARERAKQGNTG